jgi:hypothetical protein
MTFHIPEDHVHHAFEVLKMQDHAKARAAYEFTEKQLKVTLARAQLKAEGKTVGEREATALASSDYAKALEAFRAVAEVYHVARDRREAAAAIIDAWRTQQSDLRAMGRVA